MAKRIYETVTNPSKFTKRVQAEIDAMSPTELEKFVKRGEKSLRAYLVRLKY